MQHLIQICLDNIEEARTTHAYSIAGACINITAEMPFGTFKTTIGRREIIATLMLAGTIAGHDPDTNMVKVEAGFITLHEAISKVDSFETFTKDLLRLHLSNARNITTYEHSAEHLWPYFNDYSLLEKQALIYMLAQEPFIQTNEIRTAYISLRNFSDGTSMHFDRTVSTEVQLFAKWLKQNDGSLLHHALQQEPTYNIYTVNLA